MKNFDETTRISDVKHLCLSDNVEEAVRKAYDLAQSIMMNVMDLCEVADLVEYDEPLRGPIHNISLKSQMIVNTLSKYVEE